MFKAVYEPHNFTKNTFVNGGKFQRWKPTETDIHRCSWEKVFWNYAANLQ